MAFHHHRKTPERWMHGTTTSPQGPTSSEVAVCVSCRHLPRFDRLEPKPSCLVALAHAVDRRNRATRWMSRIASDVHTEMNGLRHHGAWCDGHDLLDQLTDSLEHAARIAGVDGRKPSRVTGIPSLDELERRAIANFAHDDS